MQVDNEIIYNNMTTRFLLSGAAILVAYIMKHISDNQETKVQFCNQTVAIQILSNWLKNWECTESGSEESSYPPPPPPASM